MSRKKDDYQKVFDVSKPHKVAPSASAKPIIVGHHPVMADPMVLEERQQQKKPHQFLDKTEAVMSQPIDQPAPQTPVTMVISPTIVSSSQNVTPPAAPEKAYTTYGTPKPTPEGPAVSGTIPSLVAPISEIASHEVNQQSQLNASDNTPLVTTSSGAAANPAVAMPASSEVLPEDHLRLPAGEASKAQHKQIIWWTAGILVLAAASTVFVMKFLA